MGGPIKPRRKPDLADPYLKQGLEALDKGFLSDAVAAFEKGLEASPQNIESLLNLGYLHLQMGNFKNSFDAFAKAVAYHPKSRTAHLSLGHMYWLGGRGNEALDQWRLVESMNLDLNRGLHVVARAEQIWKRVLDNNPTDADAHSNLGIILLFSGHMKEAITEFESVLQLAPQRTEHQFYAAQAYSLLYFTGKNSAFKREARNRLQQLAQMATPFPHAQVLNQFLERL